MSPAPIGPSTWCHYCRSGTHPHDKYGANAPEVQAGKVNVGDDAGCPFLVDGAACQCTHNRKPVDDQPLDEVILDYLRNHGDEYAFVGAVWTDDTPQELRAGTVRFDGVIDTADLAAHIERVRRG